MGSMERSQESVCRDFCVEGSRCLKGGRRIATHVIQGDPNLVASSKVTLCWGENSVVVMDVKRSLCQQHLMSRGTSPIPWR